MATPRTIAEEASTLDLTHAPVDPVADADIASRPDSLPLADAAPMADARSSGWNSHRRLGGLPAAAHLHRWVSMTVHSWGGWAEVEAETEESRCP